MTYWVVMFDSDGGESDPEGPFDCREDALTYADHMVVGGTWRWVSYEIQEEYA